MARLRRVLYLSNMDASLKFGSWEEQTLFLTRAFRKEGGLLLPAFTVMPGPAHLLPYTQAGCEVVCLNLSRFSFSTFRRLMQTLWRWRIEVVHWNCYHPLSLYLLLITLLSPTVRHYYTDHSSRPQEISTRPKPTSAVVRTLKKFLLKRYEKVFGVSQFVMDQMDHVGIWPQPHYWRHLINAERFIPNPIVRHSVRQAMGVSDECFVLLSVAHLIPEKGIDVVIRSLLSLPSPVLLWVVGTGPESEPLQDLCRQLALEDRVRFFGLQREVQPYLQAADCFVCSPLWQEAAGLVILEALACGLPVIASGVGGISESVEEGKSGFLFPPGDRVALSEHILRLHNDPHLRMAMSKAARSAVEERFSLHNRIDEYLAFYRVDSA